MAKVYPGSTEPEYYSGTTTFVNLKNIEDSSKLKELESDLSFIRSFELLQDPTLLEQTFDFSYLKNIHLHIFQDLYSWAGKPRSFDMAKNGDEFTKANELSLYEAEVFKESQQFISLGTRPTHSKAVYMLATSIRKINAFHPFPEGNGRSQRVFISTLAKVHDFHIDWKSIQNWEAPEVFHQAHNGNAEPLDRMIERILTERI